MAGLADEAAALEGRYSTGLIVQLMDSAAGHYHRCLSLLDHTRTHTAHQHLQGHGRGARAAPHAIEAIRQQA